MRTKLLLFALFITIISFGQSNFWQTSRTTNNHELIPLGRMPEEYVSYKVNLNNLQDYLKNAPDYFSKKASDLIIDIPDENGELVSYRVYQSHTMSPGLQAKYPNIRAYRAFGLNNKNDIASIVVSPFGVHMGIMRSGKHDLIIQSTNKNANQVIVYTKDHVPPTAFQCYTDESFEASNIENISSQRTLINDNVLRTYRFAVGTTGEYSQFHINQANLDANASDSDKKAAVLAAIIVTIDRVNSVFERDLSVSLELVPNETEAIFLDSNTDPYDNDDITQMISINTDTLDNAIGADNYDGGHLFSTYPSGGLSILRIICSEDNKGSSVTGLANPVGDSYDIDFVAHEIGHAFGCHHTYANACNGQRKLSKAVEPGSGSTIMAYAGVCAPNVQSHSDDYFHAISILEASSFVTSSATCSTNTDIGNHAPVINVINYGNVYIPSNTPFMLEATATDQDNDPLTYSWEEIDPISSEDSNITSWYPTSTRTSGPAFRAYAPKTVGVRYFPLMASILNGSYRNTWEVLPKVDRTMKIAITVRDNHHGGGQSPIDFVTLHFDSNSGPFRITNMTEGETFEALTNHQITWDVAGTDSGLVNCQTVDVLYSVDNGATFPWIIAENLPNTGSATITIPDYQNTNLARFMVKGHNNYFFDVTKGRFKVTGATGSVLKNNIKELSVYPNPTNKILHIALAPQYFTDNVNISIYDLTGREIFNKKYISTNNFNQNINVSDFKKGIYYLKIKNGKDTATRKIIIK